MTILRRVAIRFLTIVAMMAVVVAIAYAFIFALLQFGPLAAFALYGLFVAAVLAVLIEAAA